MNDRDPDDLFDALRRAWADSHPQPPASLWNRVQAQVQPPAAQPQLRRRNRRVGWLLGLLLLLLSGLSWHYWPTPDARLREAHGESSAHQAPRAASEPAPLAETGAVPGPRAQRDPTHSLPYPPTRATPAPAIAERATSGRGRGAGSPFASNSFGADSGAATRVSQKEKAVAVRPLLPPTGSSSAARLTRGPHSRTRAGAVLLGSKARQLRKTAVFSQLPDRHTRLASAGKTRTGSPRPAQGPTSRELRTVRRQPEQNQSDLVTSPKQSPGPALSASSGTLEDAGALAGRRESAGLASEPNTILPEAGTAVIDLLAFRRVALATAALPLPSPQLRADTTLDKLVVPLLRRWSIQVLSGPARSYRRLGNEEFTFRGRASSLPPFPIRLGPGAAAANRRAEYESPGTGLNLQLRAQRMLTGRWSLSAGVGYQEYAVESLYPVDPIIILPGGRLPPPYTSRDTYRFVSVPVRVSYTLGYAGPVWYGLVAGSDLSLYVGGTSAGTGLRPRAWHTSDSPYRPLQLALSAGLDLRCQLGPGLQALVQPNLTSYLTSLTKPETGLAPRYLHGVGIQVGLSYGFPARRP